MEDCKTIKVVGLNSYVKAVREIKGQLVSREFREGYLVAKVFKDGECYRVVAKVTIRDVVGDLDKLDALAKASFSEKPVDAIAFALRVKELIRVLSVVPKLETSYLTEEDLAILIALTEILKRTMLNYISKLDETLIELISIVEASKKKK